MIKNISCLILIALLAGCEPVAQKSSIDNINNPLGTKQQYQNGFVPTKLKVNSAFTKIKANKGEIEVFVEFFDQHNDPIKVLGKVQFELYRWQAADADPRGESIKIDSKPIDISTVNLSQKYWDRITGHYRFKINIPDTASGLNTIVIQIVCILTNNTRLEDTAVITL
ncbi:MAG: hypothetical protein JEZ07_09115 [Phycisphaerae bacterium]|nr:hypothetical protein [Phycisphaerae bacterium]